MHFDVFNGDADGICALLQLRQTFPCDSKLVTGVKREIDLLRHVSVNDGDTVSVLDISLDKNRVYLDSILEKQTQVLYVDHHYAGEIPLAENLNAIIDESSNTSTCALMNCHLSSSRPLWAAVGTFGDNLKELAMKQLEGSGLSKSESDLLEELGVYINYNGYGEELSDLHYSPEKLYKLLEPYDNPLNFISDCQIHFHKLKDSYRSDFSKALMQKPERSFESSKLFILPQESWSRRVVGVFGNHLTNTNPNLAYAVLVKNSEDSYKVSVRAPKNSKVKASDLCCKFPSGGGRSAAAGINKLHQSDFDEFIKRFEGFFGT